MPLLIGFDERLRPENGHQLLHMVAGPISISYKEPAGIAFQTAVLKQQGLLGEVTLHAKISASVDFEHSYAFPAEEPVEEATSASQREAEAREETNTNSLESDQPPPG
jgi:hypothetical protein